MQTKQFKRAKFDLLWSCKDGFSSFLLLQEKKQFNLFKPISYSNCQNIVLYDYTEA